MRKTDKKLENQLRLILTDVCETALKEIHGFQWLTHLVNYAHFPKSLKVVCIFDTNEHLADFLSEVTSRKGLESLMQKKLTEISINVKNITEQIAYDTEENCEREHNGNWTVRLG
tara:strand:+ start:1156 stop:1500 length:345 start_codon:yes stop_codon:yes gene_type:complete